MAVAKLNEAMLFQMGFDRVAIEAFRHIYNQVGSEIGGPTLPTVVEQVVTVVEKVEYLDLSPAVFDKLDPQGDQSPPYIATNTTEHLETGIRTALEQIAILQHRINDLEQGTIL